MLESYIAKVSHILSTKNNSVVWSFNKSLTMSLILNNWSLYDDLKAKVYDEPICYQEQRLYTEQLNCERNA